MYILKCPRCAHIREWSYQETPEGPGHCACKTSRYWDVIKTRPKHRGHVILITDKGRQELKGPHWQEDPEGFKK